MKYRYEIMLGGTYEGPVTVLGEQFSQFVELGSHKRYTYDQLMPLLAAAMDTAAEEDPHRNDREILGRAIELLVTATANGLDLLEAPMARIDVRGFIDVARRKAAE